MVRSFRARLRPTVRRPRGKSTRCGTRSAEPHRSPHSVSRALSTLLAVLVLLGTALPVAANEPEPPKTPAAAEVVPGEVVVKWRDPSRGPDVARARGLALVAELGVPGKGMPALVSTQGRAVDAVIAELNADPAVEYAEPNYVTHLAAAVAVNDPKTAGQYSLDRMRVRDAWSLTKGGSG